MTNQTKPDSATPGGDAKEWLLKVMGEWDFSIPVGAFDSISSMLKPVTDEQYADAEALIAHLDELHDDGGQGGEKWEPAQAAIAGIKAWQAAKSAPGGDVEQGYWIVQRAEGATIIHNAESGDSCTVDDNDSGPTTEILRQLAQDAMTWGRPTARIVGMRLIDGVTVQVAKPASEFLPEILLVAYDEYLKVAALSAPKQVGTVIGFRYRMKGHSEGYEVGDWHYNYHRAPDSFELRECEIESVWAGNASPQPVEAEGRGITIEHSEYVASRGEWKQHFWSKSQIPAKTKLYISPPEQPAIDLEQIAVLLWHRFAPEYHIEWQDEQHKAEYLDVAKAVIAIIDGAKGERT